MVFNKMSVPIPNTITTFTENTATKLKKGVFVDVAYFPTLNTKVCVIVWLGLSTHKINSKFRKTGQLSSRTTMFSQFGSLWKLVGESAQRTRKCYYSAQILHGYPSIYHQQRRSNSNLTFFSCSRPATLPAHLEAITKSNKATLQSMWAPNSTENGSSCITPPSSGGPTSPIPINQLVKMILSSQDMKRVIDRELRKCGEHVDRLNYSRMLYDAWSGMNEDPTFRAYIKNVLNGRCNAGLLHFFLSCAVLLFGIAFCRNTSIADMKLAIIEGLLAFPFTPTSFAKCEASNERPEFLCGCKQHTPEPFTQPASACPTTSTITMDQNEDPNSTSKLRWEPEELTHKYLVKQACSVTVDAVTRIITEVISSLEDVHTTYREFITVFMELLQESRLAVEPRQDLITCKMVVVRSRLDEIRRSVMELEAYLDTVERLVHVTAEAAFLGHAEYPSIALSERLQSALLQAKLMRDTTAEMERDMLELQSVIIVESGNSLK